MKVAICFLMVAATIVLSPAVEAGEIYRVGGDLGWTVPPDTFYSWNIYFLWAKQYTFVVSDVLDFYDRNGRTNLARVHEEDFVNCNFTHGYHVWYGRHKYKLRTPGMHYFTSTNPKHCEKGQKMAICVKDLQP